MNQRSSRSGDTPGKGPRKRPAARGGDRAVVDVGGEDLHLRPAPAQLRDGFREGDRDRIRFLARRACRYPHAQDVGGALVSEQHRNSLLLQRLERFGIAEELGHADQQFAEEVLQFGRILLQVLDVARHGIGLHHLHASLDPAHEGLFLVLAEVVSDFRADQAADRLQVPGQVLARAIGSLAALRRAQVGEMGQQPRRHTFDGKHVVDESRGGGTRGHATHGDMVEAGLGEHEATAVLHRVQPACAIAAAAREHDRHGVVALVLGERSEEGIDRPAVLPRWRWLAQLQHPMLDGERGVRRNHIDVVAFDDRAIRRFQHRHVGAPADEFGQQAALVRRQVLDQDEGNVLIGFHVPEEGPVRLQPAGRGADTDDEWGTGVFAVSGREFTRVGGLFGWLGFARTCSGLFGRSHQQRQVRYPGSIRRKESRGNAAEQAAVAGARGLPHRSSPGSFSRHDPLQLPRMRLHVHRFGFQPFRFLRVTPLAAAAGH